MKNDNPGGVTGKAITEDGARDKIYTFLKKQGNPSTKDEIVSKLEAGEIQKHPDLGDLYTFSGPLGDFWVSAQRGNVVYYYSPAAFSITEAQAYTLEFIRSNVPDFDSRNFVRVSEEANGILWEEEWEEEPQSDDEKSIFPNHISITVNLEKRAIHNFNFSDLRRIRFIEPKIPEEKARELLLKNYPDGEIIDLELVEHTFDGGVTWVTLWNATIKPDGDDDTPNTLKSINADTGKDVPL